jgi:hypothetical protein
MESGFYRFKLGQFECTSLLDGSMDYPIQNFYANVSREQVEAALYQRNLPLDMITTPYTYLYVDTGQNRVLVDMGAGDLGAETGHLVQSIQAAGISPTDIDSGRSTPTHAITSGRTNGLSGFQRAPGPGPMNILLPRHAEPWSRSKIE